MAPGCQRSGWKSGSSGAGRKGRLGRGWEEEVGFPLHEDKSGDVLADEVLL